MGERPVRHPAEAPIEGAAAFVQPGWEGTLRLRRLGGWVSGAMLDPAISPLPGEGRGADGSHL